MLSLLKVWLYGLIFVTVINMSSLVGAVVIPCTNKDYYKRILMFLVALAVGSLAGSGLLHLIPQVRFINCLQNSFIQDSNAVLIKGLQYN